MRITKLFKFEAAHQLTSWPKTHPCAQLHGHSYRVELTLDGPVNLDGPRVGCVMDFGDISAVWGGLIHSRLDHHNLNEVTQEENTTAEFIAKWLYQQLKPQLALLKEIRVWETETGSAIYP